MLDRRLPVARRPICAEPVRQAGLCGTVGDLGRRRLALDHDDHLKKQKGENRMTTASLVTYQRTDQIAHITLNRPEKLNAFSDDVVRELAARMRQFDTDPEAFVAVLCGAGRAF